MNERPNPENEVEKPPSATSQERAEEEAEIQPPLRVPKSTPSMSIGGGIGKTALVSLVVAVLVIILVGMMGGGSFVTKKDFETNMANMAVSVNEAVASVNSVAQALPGTVSSTVDSAISQQTSAINQSISEMSASVSELSTKMDKNMADLDEKITEMQTQMADYEDRIVALEEEAEEEEEATSEIDKDAVKVKLGYSRSFEFPSDNTTSGEITLYFQVDNTLAYDIENVGVELVLHSRGVPINLASSLCKVSGGWPLQWQKVYVGNGVFVIMGITPTYGDGLEIDADDDVAVFVTVTLGVGSTFEPTEDVTFYVEGKVTGYDIVK